MDSERPSPERRQLLADRLSHCSECKRPFPRSVTEEQAREDWGDAADDEIAYMCGGCADIFDGTAANAR